MNRVAEIVGTLAKYGLAGGLDRIDARFVRKLVNRTSLGPITDASQEARVRLVLTELGTTFIKLGQMLSTRRDLVGPALANELTRLQADVPADPFEITRATVEAELGRPLAEMFQTFSETPLASASIGQVHRAMLTDGRDVVVKVQHPGIAHRVQTDLAILHELAVLAEEFVSELRPYRPIAVVAEFRKMLVRELDFRRELRHLQIFQRHFAADSHVRFPQPIPGLSTCRVLTMEYLAGTSLSKLTESMELDRNEFAARGARIFLDMIFRDGFFHADPHPGNILILPGSVVGLLDAGMVGRVDDRLRGQIEMGMAAVMTGDAAALTDLVVQVGEAPIDLDLAGLQTEIADQLAFYWGMPLDQFQLGTALDELTEAVRRYRILLPPPMAMLLKVIVMLEGSARLLNPRFNLVEVLEPYRRRFVTRRLNPRRLLHRFLSAANDLDEVASALPRLARDMMTLARRQQFAVNLRHQHLDPSVNRLVFGMLTSALFMGSSLLWAFKAPPTMEGASVFGVLGCLVSGVLGYRLFRAIQHSGKLEE